MVKTRVLSALVGAPILLGGLFLGLPVFTILVMILIGAGLIEFHVLAAKFGPINQPVGLVTGFLFPLAAVLAGEAGVVFALGATVFAVLLWPLAARGRADPAGVGLTLLGAVYVGFLFSHLLLLRAEPNGVYLVSLVFAATWAGDIAAFFGGRAFGRRKLAPSVSPGKTWEGAVSGLGGGVLAMLGLFWIPALTLPTKILLGVVVVVASIAGDLSESWFKRQAGAKDSGTLIPGHGGVLDRFDGLLFASAASYHLLKIVA